MALYMDVERAATFGIGSPYRSVQEVFLPSSIVNASALGGAASGPVVDTSLTTISLHDIPSALFNIKRFQDSIGVGCSGWGFDLQVVPSLLPALAWFVGIMLVRYVMRRPLALLGLYLGVVTEDKAAYQARLAQGKRGLAALSAKNQSKLFKFQNQVWLTLFYTVSTAFGYYVQHDKPWFKFPLDDVASVHMLVPHPYNPPAELMLYYHYGLAFYLAELFSLLVVEVKVKRSDFLEYVFHHLVTLMLITFSHVGWEHRFGAYVLFLHDASDIMLSFSKSLHYVAEAEAERGRAYDAEQEKLAKLRGDGAPAKKYRPSPLYRYFLNDTGVNGCFVVFVAIFFYLRLYCLPMMARATMGMTPRLRHGNFNMWLLVLLLNVALQSLHVYWALLIVVLAVALFTGGERKDIRSEDDEDEEENPATAVAAEANRKTENDPVVSLTHPTSEVAAKTAPREEDDEPRDDSSEECGQSQQTRGRTSPYGLSSSHASSDSDTVRPVGPQQ